jgi:hypothetical protein
MYPVWQAVQAAPEQIEHPVIVVQEAAGTATHEPVVSTINPELQVLHSVAVKQRAQLLFEQVGVG